MMCIFDTIYLAHRDGDVSLVMHKAYCARIPVILTPVMGCMAFRCWKTWSSTRRPRTGVCRRTAWTRSC